LSPSWLPAPQVPATNQKRVNADGAMEPDDGHTMTKMEIYIMEPVLIVTEQEGEADIEM
jgi:hypothetical protein